MPNDDATAKRRVRIFKLCPSQILDACGAPPDSEIVEATTDENGIFVFTIRNQAWSPYPAAEPIPYGEGHVPR